MAVKSCPKCNEDNSATSSLCLNCGTSLGKCEVIGSTKEPNYSYFGKNGDTVICPTCRETLPAKARNCKFCGEFIAKTVNQASAKSGRCSSKIKYANCNILLYISTFILPFAGIIVGGILTASDDTYKQEFGRGLLKFGLAMMTILILCGVLLIGYALKK